MASSRRADCGQGSGGSSLRPTQMDGSRESDVVAVRVAAFSKSCQEDTSLFTVQKGRMHRRRLFKEATEQQQTQHLLRSQGKNHEAHGRRRRGFLTSTWTRSPALALWSLLLVIGYCSLATAEDVTEEVANLGADSDFNKVRLHWRYPRMDSDFGGFKVTHCEDQAWGPHRCRNFVLRPNELTQMPVGASLVEYSSLVPHLRMATNYTMTVTALTRADDAGALEDPPASTDDGRRISNARGRAIPNARGTAQVFIQTKGFSARAVSCLTNSTQVEVETGPYFGGKISVEGSLESACATHGNAKDPTTKYRLDINHALCGSKLLNDSVRTYILVQENLPILTHSTRRFMVVCHYVPEAFTVSAGVSLPEEVGPASLVPVDQTINEVDPSELFDFTNDLFSGRPTGRTGKSLKLQQEDEEPGPRMWTQLVLMVILVVAAVVGLSCAFWHFGKHAGLANQLRGDPLPSAASELEAVSSDAGSVAGEPDMEQEEHPDDHGIRQEAQQHLQPQDQQTLPDPVSSPEGPHNPLSHAAIITTHKIVDSTSNAIAATTVSSVSVANWSPSDSSATNPTKTTARLTGENIFVHDLLDTGGGAIVASSNRPAGVACQSADPDSERIYANAPAGSGWEQFDEDKAPMSDCSALTYSAVQV